MLRSQQKNYLHEHQIFAPTSFDPEKYDIQYSYLYTQIESFDTKSCICLKCHKNLSKKKMLCKSICNKLAREQLPEEIK